jgi:hypothetical protein
MALWKVSCQEDKYPGMWQRWFRDQCVGIGWPPADGWRFSGKSRKGEGWERARNTLAQVKLGDQVIVTLRGHKVGRFGEVTRVAVRDEEWNPLVPPSRYYKTGQMGRRILVRWDLRVGPTDRDMIVALPAKFQFSSGELRPTIGKISSRSEAELKKAMNDEQNWVGLLTHFHYERALSEYIGAYPHRLEDGLLPHPDKRVREKIFRDGSRSDVLLTDRNGRTVIVECKQGSPTLKHLMQLRHYMALLKKETKGRARGILVHGGSRNLSPGVARAARTNPKIEIVQYALDVNFAPCVLKA